MSLRALLLLSPLALLLACGDKGDDPAGTGGGEDGGGDDGGGDDGGDDGEDCVPTDEVCDGVDNDCDGDIDEDATDTFTAYTDADGDGFGDDASPVEVCELASGQAEEGGDCDDSDATVHPDATEVCDGVDNDCDEVTDGVSVPGDYDTIQEALDGADAGALVCVGEGTWDETLSLTDKVVSLSGAGEDLTLILPSDPSQTALSLSGADGLVLMDLSLGGLEVVDSDGLYAESVTLTGTTCEDALCEGSALHIDGSTVELMDVDVVGNEQGGLSTSEDFYSYGIVRVMESTLDWYGGELSENTVDRTGKASYVYGLVSLESSTITATDLWLHDNAIYSVTNAGTTSNAYSNVQGFLYAGDCDVSFEEVIVEDSEVQSQWAPGDDGGGPKGMAASSYTTSAQATAWVYASGTAFRWTGGGVLRFSNYNQGGTYALGRGAYFGSEVLELTDLDFHDNDIAATSSSWVTAESSGIYSNSSDVQLTRVDLRGNDISSVADATYLYGLLVHWNGTANYDNVVIAGNVLYAYDYTTALVSLNYLEATPVLSQLTVHDNEVDGYWVGSGGVHYWNTSGLTVVNSVFSNNSTGGYEADGSFAAAQAIFGQTGGAPDVSYTDFYGNSGGAATLVISGGTTDSTSEVLAMDGVLEVDPGYADLATASDPLSWDLHLASDSDLVDAGDPGLSDADGSTSDMGAYGGEHGDW